MFPHTGRVTDSTLGEAGGALGNILKRDGSKERTHPEHPGSREEQRITWRCRPPFVPKRGLLAVGEMLAEQHAGVGAGLSFGRPELREARAPRARLRWTDGQHR